ncbi:MAG TPA: alkaline phosphatase family protein [Planctomycetota bacterium]|nr:alkaline phosphatase family protein [Planctomycetota bacterium]
MSSFTPYERIIVLALDSVCWELLQPYAADATMPTLAALMKTSSYGVLESTVPPHTAAAWTTFLTGKDPGHHGIIDFVGFDPAAHRFKFHTSAASRADSILSRLSGSEISCGSIFLPRCYPPYPLHEGYMISGFETPNVDSPFSEPKELKDEVLGLSPQMHFNFEDDWEEDKDDPAFARNIERAMNAVDLLERLAVHFQRERPVRLQIAYLQATDILFHKAWRWCDPKTSAENPFRAEQIRKFFRRVDQLINRVLGVHSSSSTSGRFRAGGAQDKTLRVIVSDHGHGSSNGRVFINNLLKDWGYLAPLSGLKRASRRLRLLTTFDAEERRVKSRELPLDWSRTKAYLAHVGIYGFVYLNLKGREPNGIVSSGEFEKLRDELIAKFKAAKIPGTDQPLFIDAFKGEKIYARKKELNLPDIVLAPADGYYPRKKLSRGPAVRVTPKSIGGVHRSQGVYLFQGAGIAAGGAPAQSANIADMAPTLLAALGEAVPTTMTGKVMSHVFQQAPKVEKVKDDKSTAPAESESAYTKEEEQAIEKRLADLGYLE